MRSETVRSPISLAGRSLVLSVSFRALVVGRKRRSTRFMNNDNDLARAGGYSGMQGWGVSMLGCGVGGETETGVRGGGLQVGNGREEIEAEQSLKNVVVILLR